MTREKDPNVLEMFTIYDHPEDFPDFFVVRHHSVGPDGKARMHHGATAATLEDARRLIPEGLHRVIRDTEDAPCVVETWL